VVQIPEVIRYATTPDPRPAVALGSVQPWIGAGIMFGRRARRARQPDALSGVVRTFDPPTGESMALMDK
jgi:hypothetical protein